MEKTLYDSDFVAWTEQQAVALRALASRPDLSNSVDWENVIDEVETLGRSVTSGVTRSFRLAFVHILNIASVPNAPSLKHWTAEAALHLFDAQTEFLPLMRQLIALDTVWRRARKEASLKLQPYGDALAAHLPSGCPFTLDDLLEEAFDIDAAVAKLTAAPH